MGLAANEQLLLEYSIFVYHLRIENCILKTLKWLTPPIPALVRGWVISPRALTVHAGILCAVSLLYSDDDSYVFLSAPVYISLEFNNQVNGLACLGKVCTFYHTYQEVFLSCVKL